MILHVWNELANAILAMKRQKSKRNVAIPGLLIIFMLVLAQVGARVGCCVAEIGAVHYLLALVTVFLDFERAGASATAAVYWHPGLCGHQPVCGPARNRSTHHDGARACLGQC
jgi:hypothetical protein